MGFLLPFLVSKKLFFDLPRHLLSGGASEQPENTLEESSPPSNETSEAARHRLEEAVPVVRSTKPVEQQPTDKPPPSEGGRQLTHPSGPRSTPCSTICDAVGGVYNALCSWWKPESRKISTRTSIGSTDAWE